VLHTFKHLGPSLTVAMAILLALSTNVHSCAITAGFRSSAPGAHPSSECIQFEVANFREKIKAQINNNLK